MVARALGWEVRTGVVQFIKGKRQTGERHFFRRFPDLMTYQPGYRAQHGIQF